MVPIIDSSSLNTFVNKVSVLTDRSNDRVRFHELHGRLASPHPMRSSKRLTTAIVQRAAAPGDLARLR